MMKRDCLFQYLTISILILCALYRPTSAQFPPFPLPCTPATPPPLELKPLDSDANLLPGCSLPNDRVQKSAISETTAQQLALCNSFCINRVFSGAFTQNDTQKQSIPGYPVWLLATVSYLLSEDGLNGTDCVVGDNGNGCDRRCDRFIPVSSFPFLIPGGHTLALDCKLGCMLHFESPASTTCADDCRMNCNSVVCQCPIFGEGCFANVAPPCGRDCSAASCGLGCTDANSHTNSTPTYPSPANPTQAPVVTQINNGTRYMIDITDSIPSGVFGDLGYSTLIVRVHDLSSTTPNDFTYYVLENGFEFDLAPFECRRIEISFAVATNEMAVSSYSPSAMLELSTAGSIPDQLTDFNFTVEQDNRAGFFQHHMIHLEWDPPQNVEFATGYTITLSPVINPDVCLSATFDITNGSLTGYIIQSRNSAQPPISNCIYTVQIKVNPRDPGRAIAQKTISRLQYNNPSTDNIAHSCSSTLNRSSISYDLTFTLHLDETFTPAVISAIANLRAGSFHINERGDAIIGQVTHRRIPLGSDVTQGPITIEVPYNNFTQLLDGLGYSLTVSFEWNNSPPVTPPALSVICQIYDVTPIPPDPVKNIAITFQQVLPSGSDQQGGRINITLRYMWIAPVFQGEGITGYQAWLSKEIAPERAIVTGGLRQIARNATNDELVMGFDESDTNFTLYFQIRPISANTVGNWSEPIILNVQDLPPTALNVNVTCSSVVNMTTRSYDITVHFFIDATFTVSRVAAIESISTTIAEVDSSGIVVLSNFRREVFPFQGIEKGPGSVTLMFPNKMPLINNQSFYSVQSFLVWKSSFPSLPSTVGGSCQLQNVGPLPPDPITNLQLLSVRKRFSTDRKTVRVTANFTWTAPEFIGTGSIVGYQVWFNQAPASNNVTRFITHGAQARSAEIEMIFDIGETDFSLYLQIRALGAASVGNWSKTDRISLQIQVPCPVGFFRDPSVMSFQCIPCPANTNLILLNEATVCPCLPGYFRALDDDPGVSCSRPPTACRNFRINLLGDRRIDVVWGKPFFTGRDDFYYVLEWSASLSPSLLNSLGFSGREINGSFIIFDSDDVVSHSITGLRPETPYSIAVTTRNGVSDQDVPGNEDLRRCRLEEVTFKAANGSLSLPSTMPLTTLLGCGVDIMCGGAGVAVAWRVFGTGIELTNSNATTVLTKTNSTGAIVSHLIINPVMESDAGTGIYMCSVFGSEFPTVVTYSFLVIVNNTFAYVEPIEDIELTNDQLGQMITINCRVSTCSDNAEIVFARDFEILNRAELFADATNIGLSTNLVVSDNITGNYQCRVIQDDMIHQTTFRITKRRPPVTCPFGTYKNSTSAPIECLPCPANTNRSVINATVCPCLPGYFRTSSEEPETGCTSPPSACRNIQSNFVGAHSLNVLWERPENTGRDDYYYTLQYTDGESVGSNQVVNRSQVVSQLITGLKPVTEYTITVTVANGVSGLDKENEFKRMCELIITTIEGVPSDPVDVQFYGDVVVWNEPLNPNGQIIEYEIQFLIPGTQLRINRSRNSRGTFYAVQEEDKLGGIQDTYFRIRARTSAGAGQWSIDLPLRSGVEETPTPPITCPTCSCPICTCPVCPTTVPPCTCGTETPTSPPQLQGIHFVLRGRPLANNSVIALTDVGELGGALLCRTNLTSCCGTLPNRFGQFYYPSGEAVPVNSQRQGFYRNRGDQEIRLHRRSGVNSPIGKFRCEIPDSNLSLQNIFVVFV